MSLCGGSLPPDMCVCPHKPLLRVFPTTLKEMGPSHSSHWCHLWGWMLLFSPIPRVQAPLSSYQGARSGFNI